ncbi:cache domain-containing protein [Desulfospira joergensenii]|uniref:cache domain-containing protein n=1 Tax=Desulfospira joergensenii TaxID=53329 RepID=UPI0003B75F77|nr:cache domain-containing protein [Desulfospira joergensenii]
MRKFFCVFCFVTVLVFSFQNVNAQDSATPEEVYQLVLKAYPVLQNLKEESFSAFNDPKGEFVYKNTYVVVIKCPSHTMTHPFAENARGMEMPERFSWFPTMCEAANHPNGKWVEYEWPKPGETEPSRKISFVIAVEGTPFALVAGIYTDSGSVDDLNATLK